MESNAEDRLLPLPEVARQIGFGVATVRRLISAGALDGVKVLGRLRVPNSSLQAFIRDLATDREHI